MGFEAFNFKKLAEDIGTTEASIYRYFENKHKLLVYLTAWYWGWVEFQISFQTNNILVPDVKLKKVIQLLATAVEDEEQSHHITSITVYCTKSSFRNAVQGINTQNHWRQPSLK